MRSIPTRLVRAGTAIVLAALLAACTTEASINRRPHPGSATASMVNGMQQVTVTAGNTYRFDPSTITVHPGWVRIVLINTGSGAPHDWSLLGDVAATAPLVGGGASSSVTFTAPAPGRYPFVCTIHSAQGQTGTLVVLNR